MTMAFRIASQSVPLRLGESRARQKPSSPSLSHSSVPSQTSPQFRAFRTVRRSMRMRTTCPSPVSGARSSGNSFSWRTLPSSPNASTARCHSARCESFSSPRYGALRWNTRLPTRTFSTMLQYRWTLPSLNLFVARRNMPVLSHIRHGFPRGQVFTTRLFTAIAD